MDERAVSELRELAGRDAELAARADRLRAPFFAAYPATETRLRGATQAAEEELGRRREELAAAEENLAHARDEEARALARKTLARAVDHRDAARGRVARAKAEQEDLERRATVLPNELPRLEVRAAAVARELDDAAPPAGGLPELIDWAAHAHASIFVAANHGDSERERLIREANELATMLLGEPTFGATAAQARARVEAAL